MHDIFLQKLGLSNDESTLYLFLLKNPLKNIGEISKTTHINRPKLYKIIPNLVESWILSEVIIGKRKHYRAEHPKILKNYLSSIEKDFSKYIPEIENLYIGWVNRPILKHYLWKSGIKNIFLDIANSLPKWWVFYRYSSRRDVENTSISWREYDEYKIIRDEKELGRYVITNQYLKDLKPEKLDKEVVIIPKSFDIFEDNITKIIYWDKVAIIDYNSFESFVIESALFAGFEKKIFKLLFQFLKKSK